MTANGRVKSISKHVLTILYMIEFIPECRNTLKPDGGGPAQNGREPALCGF